MAGPWRCCPERMWATPLRATLWARQLGTSWAMCSSWLWSLQTFVTNTSERNPETWASSRCRVGDIGRRAVTWVISSLQCFSALFSFLDFLFFWGVIFLVSTTLVAIMKKESGQGRGDRGAHEETQGVMETYKLLFSIIKLPTVFTFCVLLLTAKVH